MITLLILLLSTVKPGAEPVCVENDAGETYIAVELEDGSYYQLPVSQEQVEKSCGKSEKQNEVWVNINPQDIHLAEKFLSRKLNRQVTAPKIRVVSKEELRQDGDTDNVLRGRWALYDWKETKAILFDREYVKEIYRTNDRHRLIADIIHEIVHHLDDKKYDLNDKFNRDISEKRGRAYANMYLVGKGS